MPRGSNKLTTEEFIAKAQAHPKHKGKGYDYSGAVYVNNKTKLDIICPKHGKFEQVPRDHLIGAGCSECGREAVRAAYLEKSRKAGAEFTEKSNAVHGSRYDYSRAVYGGMKAKVIIICKKHGEFKQLPGDHLKRAGCPTCAKKSMAAKAVEKCRVKFIDEANVVHKFKYDYSFAEYTNSKEKLVIVCPKHGKFKQSPNPHLKGIGCPECGNDVKRARNRIEAQKAAERFEDEGRRIHGDQFDYSKVEYKGNKVKVLVCCRGCDNEFSVSPNSHLKGNGCPNCASSKMNKWGHEIAEELGLDHSIEARFDDCRDKNPLPFDLAIHVDGEVHTLVEFHGRQHYVAIDAWGGEEALTGVKKRDKIKRKFAKDNGYNFIEVKYTHRDKGCEHFREHLIKQFRKVGLID
jgi:hypothetical protein